MNAINLLTGLIVNGHIINGAKLEEPDNAKDYLEELEAYELRLRRSNWKKNTCQ